jgi:hypothetical protein
LKNSGFGKYKSISQECKIKFIISVSLLSVVLSAGTFAGIEPNDRVFGLRDSEIIPDRFLSQTNILRAVRNDSISKDTIHHHSHIHDIKNAVVEKITVSHPNIINTNDADKAQNLINMYASYQGKIIRKIEFKQLEIFGQSVEDTTRSYIIWPEKLANELHISTQQYVLRNQSVIKPGDSLDVYMLAENERLLRELPFIDDARAVVSTVNQDSVDILFITKDVLPLGFGLELLDIAYGQVNVYNKNVLGLGHELGYALTWNYNKNPFYGHKLLYRITNIRNTFFSLDATYEIQWNIEAFRFYLDRNFFSQNTRYAGGVGFEKIYSLKDIMYPDSVQKDVKVDYNLYDLWLGRAILLSRSGLSRSRTNIAVTGRVTRYESFRGPIVNGSLLSDFWNRTTCLATLGISRQGYFKSRLIYGYGRVEDIPFGLSLSFTGGVEFNQFKNRPYFGITYAQGTNMKRYGYLYKQIAFGTFADHGIEQGLLQIQASYFTDLINRTGRYKYRVYLDMLYKAGFKRFADEYMEFTKRDGIRGLGSDSLRGNQRINLNLEADCFSPHYLMGFRFVYYLFMDVGLIANKSTILLNNPLYSGFGAGIRIRNDNLVFEAIQLRFAFYPVIPVNASPEYFLFTATSDRKFSNFTIPKPEVMQYQSR